MEDAEASVVTPSSSMGQLGLLSRLKRGFGKPQISFHARAARRWSFSSGFSRIALQIWQRGREDYRSVLSGIPQPCGNRPYAIHAVLAAVPLAGVCAACTQSCAASQLPGNPLQCSVDRTLTYASLALACVRSEGNGAREMTASLLSPPQTRDKSQSVQVASFLIRGAVPRGDPMQWLSGSREDC